MPVQTEEDNAAVKYNPVVVQAYWKSCGLPQAVSEYKFHPVRKFRFDFAFVAERVYIEADGGIWIAGGHNRGAQILHDWEKRNEATVYGWRGIWCQPKDLCTADLARTIERALL